MTVDSCVWFFASHDWKTVKTEIKTFYIVLWLTRRPPSCLLAFCPGAEPEKCSLSLCTYGWIAISKNTHSLSISISVVQYLIRSIAFSLFSCQVYSLFSATSFRFPLVHAIDFIIYAFSFAIFRRFQTSHIISIYFAVYHCNCLILF